MSTGEIIRRAGTALFGNRYKADLAHALGVSVDRLDNWSKDRGNVPPDGVWSEIHAMIQDRQEQLRAILPAVIERGGGTTVSRTFQQIRIAIGRDAPWSEPEFFGEVQKRFDMLAKRNAMENASIRFEPGRYVIEVPQKVDDPLAGSFANWLDGTVVAILREKRIPLGPWYPPNAPNTFSV